MSISAWVSIGRTNLRADAPIVVSADFTPATAAFPTQPFKRDQSRQDQRFDPALADATGGRRHVTGAAGWRPAFT
ncbi:hypothetical protein [Bosea sp. RAC05]|jgi:hypothetical protein|uniref:hypothetical protein n=1 Tax=Bosea sp. RAC05 TaxID=1842539 RepID=UPI00123791A6|nr:hypothetical protein [Bosea sp. RAC05]